MTLAGSPSVRPVLGSLAAIREYLRDSPQPVFYISRSATNLVGLDRWVGGFHFVTLRDNWDGRHPRSFSPTRVPSLEPRGNVNVANWLLRNAEVQAYIAARTPAGFQPQVVITMFDESTERICRDLGYELIMPSAELRSRLDSKVVTTQLGNEAGSLSVPNMLTTITGWADLRAQADRADLGERLVVQLPYGDSGRTTYFIASEADFDRVASEITGAEIKVMRYINHLPLAAEAVITSAGTVVGPTLREITGHPELTAYQGGWSGSELYPDMLPADTADRLNDLVTRFCDRLAEEGYRGILEVSILCDTDTGEIYLGELNPRISGSSSHSNLTPGDETLPLFAYHVLEYSGADFTLDIPTIKQERERALAGQTWSTLVIQNPAARVDRVRSAPVTGRYRVVSGGSALEFVSPDLDWQGLDSPDEVFWLRSVGDGEIRGRGLDLGLLVARTRAQEDHYALTPRTKLIIPALQRLYRSVPVSPVRVYWRAALRRLRGFAAR